MEEEYADHQKVVESKTKELTDYETEVKNKSKTKKMWLENSKSVNFNINIKMINNSIILDKYKTNYLRYVMKNKGTVTR